MDALRHEIQTNRVAMSHNVKGATRRKIENLIFNLLARVEETKNEFNMEVEGWVHMEHTSSQYQFYSHFTNNYEAYAHFCLGNLQSLDLDSTETAIMHFKTAQDLYKSVGSKTQANVAKASIGEVRAELDGDVEGQLESIKNIYENRLEFCGENSEETIMNGIRYAYSLRHVNRAIEAERLAAKLAAISHRVYGENHECTKKSVELLNTCKVRLVRTMSPAESSNDKVFRALQYENDGEICVLDQDDEEGQTFQFACEG